MVLGWVVSSYTAVAEAIMALFSSGGENSGSRNIMWEELIKKTEIQLASKVQKWEEKMETIFQMWEKQIETIFQMWEEQIERCEKIRAFVSCLKEQLKFISVDDLRELKIEIASRGPTLEEALIECEKNLDSIDEKLKLISERKSISVLDIMKMFDDIIKDYNTVFPGSYGRTFANKMAPVAQRLEEKVASMERMLEKDITLIRLEVREQNPTARRLITIIREDHQQLRQIAGIQGETSTKVFM